jgi:hypothetical protein
MKNFLVILLSLTIVFSTTIPVGYADSIQDCREEVGKSLSNVMGDPDSNELHGYLKSISDLMSTNLPSHVLVDQVEQIARDARLETTSVCTQVARFQGMDSFYRAAYGLSACSAVSTSSTDASAQLSILTFCEERADILLDSLLDNVREYLLRQAVRTSMEPVIQRMRSLNSRLTVLISEYSRLVNNFFTFSFRLGDTIIGEG